MKLLEPNRKLTRQVTLGSFRIRADDITRDSVTRGQAECHGTALRQPFYQMDKSTGVTFPLVSQVLLL